MDCPKDAGCVNLRRLESSIECVVKERGLPPGDFLSNVPPLGRLRDELEVVQVHAALPAEHRRHPLAWERTRTYVVSGLEAARDRVEKSPVARSLRSGTDRQTITVRRAGRHRRSV